MKLSRKTDYGIILLKFLAPTYKSGEFVAVSEIAEKHLLPAVFLEKLADILRKNKYLEAKRGNKGGYRLIKNPQEINLREMIDVFEEKPMMRCMQSAHPEKYCPLVSVCPARKTWSLVDEKVNKIFKGITLARL